ncbi:11209_t:CDS:10 [Paraglomus brasilianum]|uniref:11209_t:CDS:1 n=1 Tax=Paraglomus brasilianum TaxID=144538 RepID=A0A9N8ZFC6_9GLOM|nr:11209_t:CDS:10 [Paraglomus brasilianum]
MSTLLQPPPARPRSRSWSGPRQEDYTSPEKLTSTCDGEKKALLIGINYQKTKFELQGCHNDVENMKNFLKKFNFPDKNISILTDDQQGSSIPTKENILEAMKCLVAGAKPGDSGHGGQVRDKNEDEEDGFDETIMPLDFETNGVIVDDIMHDILVKPLPEGVRLTAIFDSCHSGTALDLPYIYSTNGSIKRSSLIASGGATLANIYRANLRGDFESIPNHIVGLFVKVFKGEKIREKNRREKSSKADVIMFGGCKDMQYSADAQENGKCIGAMSHAFITTLSADNNVSYLKLLNTVRDQLSSKYSQKPQLSASHPFNLDDIFKIMFYHPSSDVIADDITPSLCCAHPDIICYVLRGALASQALSVTGAKSYSIEESL